MNNIPSLFKILILAASVLIFFGTICRAQNKVDLEVTAQAASETARGGETFSYTVTVKNIGTAKATDVILMQDGNRSETSAAPSAGTCALLEASQQIPKPFRCTLGDIEKSESVIINFSIKIQDFGGEEEYTSSPSALPSIAFTEADKADWSKSTLADINVSAEESEENRENNRAVIRAELLPSSNKPPRVEVISPKNEIVLIKPLNKTLEVPLRIKAFDPDGKIAKVRVLEQNFQIIIEDNQYKFIFGGKKYTAQEAEDARESLAEYFGGDAVETGAGTYSYVWKNLRYGRNRISIDATDDGGRAGFTQLEVEVKSDATIEIVTPENEQVFTPNSAITIETLSKFAAGITPQIRLLGTQEVYSTSFADIPLMKQVSKVGNTYKHQFIWKTDKEGTYDFRPIAFENEQDTNTASSVRVIVAHPRVIKITSFKNGQTFAEGQPVKVTVEALNIKGEIVHDALELLVDGKSYGRIYNSWTVEPVPPYDKKIIDASRGFNLLDLSRGIHKIQVLAKQYDSLDGATMGKSELVTILVK